MEQGKKLKKPAAKKVLAAFFNGLFILFILFVGTVLVSSRGSNGLRIGPYAAYTVLTGSMSPEIEAGALIIVKKVPPAQLQVGDIITYYPMAGSDTLVTHRIIEVLAAEEHPGEGAERRFITKGDANNYADQTPVAAGAVVGVVVHGIGGFGRFVWFIKSPKGMMAFAAVFGALLMLFVVIPKIMAGQNPPESEGTGHGKKP